MRPSFPADYILNHVLIAEDSLKAMAILRYDEWGESGGIVVIGNPNGRRCYRSEIVLVPSGHLILTGDLDTMMWGIYRRGGGLMDAIHWIAESSLSYVHEKACIGMSGIGCDEFDLEVARKEAGDRLNDFESAEEATLWRKIVQELRGDEWDHRSVSEMVYEILKDCDIPALGVVPSSRLLWAWSLVKKANELIKNDKKSYNTNHNIQNTRNDG